MFELWLKELTEDKAVYYFRGEGKGEKGIIEVNRKTQDYVVIEEAEYNNEGWKGYSANKIREYIDDNNFPDKDFIAMW